uniref:HMG box domain-containing protein n=1 Tax=viral metagenome TaxID=1070528 RepID=A0A6C0C609_9ZZZZ
MTHLPFHNDTVSLQHLWFESHKNIIATVCIKLGQHDKIAELTASLLGDALKIKAMKDPDKPKRPTSGYLYFCQDARPNIMKKMGKNNAKLVLGDIAKELGKQWKALSDNKREVYDVKSKKDKERYEEDMEKYNTNH